MFSTMKVQNFDVAIHLAFELIAAVLPPQQSERA
jgi:hypothetical protein